MSQVKTGDQKEAIKSLRKFCKPNTTVYTITRHVSQSGMFRRISAFVLYQKKLICLDWYIERTGLFSRGKDDYGLKVSGCGMDMHFHVVYELGRVLYPKGFKLRKGMYGRNGDKSGYDKDGGYALKKESI